MPPNVFRNWRYDGGNSTPSASSAAAIAESAAGPVMRQGLS